MNEDNQGSKKPPLWFVVTIVVLALACYGLCSMWAGVGTWIGTQTEWHPGTSTQTPE